MSLRRLPAVFTAAFALAMLPGLAGAQSFPSKPITRVVPFPAGGALDAVARPMAEGMRKVLGQTVIVENAPGAGGTLGTGHVARAAADGYTILLGSVATHAIAAGRIRGLAVTGEQRLAALPDLPTLTQAGVPGVDVVTWFGLFAPAGTPPEIVQQLNAAATTALKDERVQRSLTTIGDESVGSSVSDFTAFVRAEHPRWVKIIQSAGIKIE